MLKSSGAMAVATLLSRVLGMARETLYSRFMGDGMVAAAFKMAFLIPNMFRRLLGEGALTAAFIPIFKDKEKNEGEERMWDAANAVISALIVAAALLSAVVVLGLSVALALDSPSDLGFAVTSIGPKSDQAAPALFSPGWLTVETRLMLQLLRIMFPYVLLICLAAIFIGMLNARGQFFVPAMGATVLNVILIGTVCILWFAPGMAEIPLHVKIFGLALAVLVAGAAQAAYQLPALRREGYRFRWINPAGNETVREVVRKMVPGMIGVAAFQLNILITQGVAYAYDPTILLLSITRCGSWSCPRASVASRSPRISCQRSRAWRRTRIIPNSARPCGRPWATWRSSTCSPPCCCWRWPSRWCACSFRAELLRRTPRPALPSLSPASRRDWWHSRLSTSLPAPSTPWGTRPRP